MLSSNIVMVCVCGKGRDKSEGFLILICMYMRCLAGLLPRLIVWYLLPMYHPSMAALSTAVPCLQAQGSSLVV